MSVSTYTRYRLSRAERKRREREIRARVAAELEASESRRRAAARAARAAEAERAREIAGLAASMARAARGLAPVKARESTLVNGEPARGADGSRELARRLESAIEAVPLEWRDLMGEELTEIERAVARAAACGYDAVHRNALEMAGQRLSRLLARIPALARERESARRSAREAAARIEETTIPVIEGSPLEQERRSAAAVLERARGLLESRDWTAAAAALSRLMEDAESLLEDYRETLLRAEERDYVRTQVIDVLEDMGYEPLDLEGGETAGERSVSCLRGPGGYPVRVEMGLDEAFRCRLQGIDGEGHDAAAGRWCSDFSSILEALADRGLHVEEYWRSGEEEERGGVGASAGIDSVEDEETFDEEHLGGGREPMRKELG